MGRQDLIRVEQLRQENERLQEKIAEYQRKELEDIRSYARLSAENISLRTAAAGKPGGEQAEVGDNDEQPVEKERWETARLQQALDRKEQEKRALLDHVKRLKKEIIKEREKRLRLERIMVSNGMDVEQLTDEEDEPDDEKVAALSSRKPTKQYTERKRHPATLGPKAKYPCPVDGCSYVMLFSTHHNPPLLENGQVSDKQGWPLPYRNNALRMRKHMEEFHSNVTREEYPMGFSKKIKDPQTPSAKRARTSDDGEEFEGEEAPPGDSAGAATNNEAFAYANTMESTV